MLECRFKIFVLVFGFFIITYSVVAQNTGNGDYVKVENPQPYKSVTKFGVASLLWGHVPYTSEYKLLHDFVSSPYASTQVGFSLFTSGPFLSILNKANPGQDKLIMRGFRLQGTQKFYLSKDNLSPEGLYIGPHVSYARCKLSTKNLLANNYYYELQQINVCGVIGYQAITGTFATDMFFGLGYKNNSLNTSSTRLLPPQSFYDDLPFFKGNVRIMLGINIGFASKAK